jgi:hypothetical protein
MLPGIKIQWEKIFVSSPQTLTHCAHEVYRLDRPGFYLSLFAPQPQREGLLALYALNVELAGVHRSVSEEMIGHIRFAWWQETLEKLYAGVAPQGHPVLQALQPVIDGGYMPQNILSLLVESYRDHYPHVPPEMDGIMEKIAVTYLRLACPEAEAAWHKAHRIVTRHRARWGARLSGWLALKLLFIGR